MSNDKLKYGALALRAWDIGRCEMISYNTEVLRVATGVLYITYDSNQEPICSVYVSLY